MDIVEELRQNRESGAKRLVSEYKAGLMSLARRFYKNECDAEELVNATFAKVIENIDDYLEQSAFFAWMCQILSNEFKDSVRRKSSKMELYPGVIPEVEDECAQEAIYTYLDASLLRDAIETLPEDIKKTLLMHYFMGMSVKDIAKFLALPSGTVMWRLHYARQMLAAKLGVAAEKAKDAAKKPGGKAVLLALALCALTAAGTGVYNLAVSDRRQTETGDIQFSSNVPQSLSGVAGSPRRGAEGGAPFLTHGEQNMNITQTTRAAAMLAAASTMTLAASGDTYTWRTSPADKSWNLTSPNWNAGEAWVDGGSAVFPSSLTDNPSIAVDGARRASDVTFDAKCTINGPGTLEVTGKIFANVGATINAGFGGASVRLGGASDKLLTMKGGNSSQAVTYIEDNAIFYINDDLRVGPVPQSQTDSIVVANGNPGLYLSSTPQLAATRTIRIAPGAGLRLGNNTTGTQQTSIKSLLFGTPDATLGYVTNTTVSFVNPWKNWNVNILFDPGEGRTNQVGRLDVATRLKIASGATLVAAPLILKTGTNAPLYVHCWATTNQFGTYHGNLTVDGGALICPQSGKYVDVGNYGQVTVMNGGLVFMPDVEWLNGLNSPGRLSVSDGGKVVLKTLRLTFSSTAGSEIRLDDGGLLSADVLGLCPPSSSHKCDFIFDGGAIQSRSGRTDFMRSTTGTSLTESDWSGVRFLVGAKGAVFDTANMQNIWWSRPLASGTDAGVADGGVRVVGAGNANGVIFTTANSYTGPTVVSNAMLQARADGALPAGTALRLEEGKFFPYDFANSAPRVTAQSVSRLEGSGIVYYAGALSINGSVAPDAGKVLDIQSVCKTLAGDYEIRGDASGCGCLKVAANQDISDLAVKVADIASLNSNVKCGTYAILEAPAGYTGQFALSNDFPSDKWRVRYSNSAAYLDPVAPTMVIMR